MVRRGLAFTAAQFWNDGSCRTRCTDLLLRLMPPSDEKSAQAIMHAFMRTETLLVDNGTERVLKAVCQQPLLLKATEDTYFVEQLSDVLSAYPDLVYDICRELVTLRSDDLKSMRTGFSANTGHLTNVALTFQRLGGQYRAKGLDLFEQLLDIGVHDAQAALNELDKRPISYPLLARPLVRRRGRKRGEQSS
jgi:hypothetical protein